MKEEKYFRVVQSGLIAKDMGPDFRMNEINNDKTFRKINVCVLPGMMVQYSERVPDTFRLTPYFKEYDPTESEKALFATNPVMISLEDIKKHTINYINEVPGLGGCTCMGWHPYEDKSKDPNYYDQEVIFPDGNTYSIVKSGRTVEVYPSKGGYNLMMSQTVAPLVRFKIDPAKWAQRYYEENESVLIIDEDNPDLL